MVRLSGARRMILLTIVSRSKDSADFVQDVAISQATQIDINDVRDLIEILIGEGCVDFVRTENGLKVAITAGGRLALRQFESFPADDRRRSGSDGPRSEVDSNPTDPPRNPAGPPSQAGHRAAMGEDDDAPTLPPPPISRPSRFPSAPIRTLVVKAAQNNALGKQPGPRSHSPRGEALRPRSTRIVI